MTEPLDDRWQWTTRLAYVPRARFYGDTLDANDPMFGALDREQLADVRTFCDAHGIAADDVREIVAGDPVEFLVYLENADCVRYVDETGELATERQRMRCAADLPSWWTPGTPRPPRVLVVGISHEDARRHAAELRLKDYVTTSPRSDRHRGVTVDEIVETPAFQRAPAEVVARVRLEVAPCAYGGRRN